MFAASISLVRRESPRWFARLGLGIVGLFAVWFFGAMGLGVLQEVFRLGR